MHTAHEWGKTPLEFLALDPLEQELMMAYTKAMGMMTSWDMKMATEKAKE